MGGLFTRARRGRLANRRRGPVCAPPASLYGHYVFPTLDLASSSLDRRGCGSALRQGPRNSPGGHSPPPRFRHHGAVNATDYPPARQKYTWDPAADYLACARTPAPGPCAIRQQWSPSLPEFTLMPCLACSHVHVRRLVSQPQPSGPPALVWLVGWVLAAMLGFNLLRALVLNWVRQQPRSRISSGAGAANDLSGGSGSSSSSYGQKKQQQQQPQLQRPGHQQSVTVDVELEPQPGAGSLGPAAAAMEGRANAERVTSGGGAGPGPGSSSSSASAVAAAAAVSTAPGGLRGEEQSQPPLVQMASYQLRERGRQVRCAGKEVQVVLVFAMGYPSMPGRDVVGRLYAGIVVVCSTKGHVVSEPGRCRRFKGIPINARASPWLSIAACLSACLPACLPACLAEAVGHKQLGSSRHLRRVGAASRCRCRCRCRRWRRGRHCRRRHCEHTGWV